MLRDLELAKSMLEVSWEKTRLSCDEKALSEDPYNNWIPKEKKPWNFYLFS